MTARPISWAVILVCLGATQAVATQAGTTEEAPTPAITSPDVTSPDGASRAMTFGEAMAAAESSPQLRLVEGGIARAEAELLTARTYPHNPVLEVSAADRSGPGGGTTDRGIALSERFELAGQGGHRRSAATSSLEAARASVAQARVETLARAARAFGAAVHARERMEIDRVGADLDRAFAELVERRLETGSATAVDQILARAAQARSARGLARSQAAFRRQQARLARAVSADPSRFVPRVVPAGPLPSIPEPPSLPRALEAATETRGELAAGRAHLEAAEAEQALARALALPDLTVGARAAREEGDDLVGLSVSIPLPLLDRNRGAIARAGAELEIARARQAVTRLAVRQEVVAAHDRLEAALDALRVSRDLEIAPLEEGLALLERSFDAGKIGAAELLLYRRELVEARRLEVEARAEAWEAAVDLAVALGGGLPGFDGLVGPEPSPPPRNDPDTDPDLPTDHDTADPALAGAESPTAATPDGEPRRDP